MTDKKISKKRSTDLSVFKKIKDLVFAETSEHIKKQDLEIQDLKRKVRDLTPLKRIEQTVELNRKLRTIGASTREATLEDWQTEVSVLRAELDALRDLKKDCTVSVKTTERLYDQLLSDLKDVYNIITRAECDCGGEEPDGSSPSCFRCLALDKIKSVLKINKNIVKCKICKHQYTERDGCVEAGCRCLCDAGPEDKIE